MTKIFYSIESISKILEHCHPSRVCVVTSAILAKKLNWAIKELGIPKSNVILVPDGEAAKEWQELEVLLDKFNKLNIDRSSIIIALGGGTIGDITGFAASIYLRGIRYIQIPTTLLAQADSAHGGKTGINFKGIKNQVGSTHLPIVTIVDKRFLGSVSDESIVDGLGEIIKVGILKDPLILNLLRKHTITSLRKSSDFEKVIKKAIKAKQFYINKDFYDDNLRQLLNFGHTIAHAIELKYKISHGRAVMIGMLRELEIMEVLGFSPASIRENLSMLLDKLGVKIDANMKADWHTVLHDKKVMSDKILFPAIEKEGKAKLIKLDLEKLKKFL